MFRSMSDDQIRANAPSVFATTASPSVSDRYRYIPSYQVVREMRLLGLHPTEAYEGKKKQPDGREYALHVVKFQKPDAVEAYHDRTTPLGHLVPQVILRNSHDRTSPLELSSGIQRKVCMNGLYVSDMASSYRVRHVGRSVADQVHSGVAQILDNFGRVIDTAEYWQGIEMSPELARRFAEAALKIRGTSLAVIPSDVVAPHRSQDIQPTLWNLFNCAQENLMTGRVAGLQNNGRHRNINRISTLASELDLNRKLWSAAAALAEEIKPRGKAVVGVAA